MTIEYIRYRIAAELQPAFVEAISGANRLLASASDCLGYQFSHYKGEAELSIL